MLVVDVCCFLWSMLLNRLMMLMMLLLLLLLLLMFVGGLGVVLVLGSLRERET